MRLLEPAMLIIKCFCIRLRDVRRLFTKTGIGSSVDFAAGGCSISRRSSLSLFQRVLILAKNLKGFLLVITHSSILCQDEFF